MSLSALEKIQEIQARADQEIRELRQQAVSEVVRRLSAAKDLVKELEAQYTALTGKNLKGEAVEVKKLRAPKAEISAEQLTGLLKAAPEKRLGRKGLTDAGYSLKSALLVAKASPKVFGFKQNGPQGEVWLKQAARRSCYVLGAIILPSRGLASIYLKHLHDYRFGLGLLSYF